MADEPTYAERMEQALDAAVDQLYQTACICRFPRFTDLLAFEPTGGSPDPFEHKDQAYLIARVMQHPRSPSTPGHFQPTTCPDCGASWTFEGYSVRGGMHMALKIECPLSPIGPPPERPVPSLEGGWHSDGRGHPPAELKRAIKRQPPEEWLAYVTAGGSA